MSGLCLAEVMTDLRMEKIVEMEKRLTELTFKKESFLQDDKRTCNGMCPVTYVSRQLKCIRSNIFTCAHTLTYTYKISFLHSYTLMGRRDYIRRNSAVIFHSKVDRQTINLIKTLWRQPPGKHWKTNCR